MRRVSLILLALSIPACGTGGQRPVPRPDTVVQYSADTSSLQRLDWFLPANDAKPFPTVVFTYGGGWHAPRGPNLPLVCESFRARGFACVLVAHRLSPQNPYPAAEEDEAAAASWVLDHVGALGGDARRVCLVGHSSGAHLAVLVTSDPRWLARWHHSPTDFACVVGLSTPVSLMPAPDGMGYGDALLGGSGADAFARDTSVMRTASPITHASHAAPPTLLIVGQNDFPMLQRDADGFAKVRRAAGQQVEILMADGRDHMGTVSALVEPPNSVSERVFQFIAAHSGAPR